MSYSKPLSSLRGIAVLSVVAYHLWTLQILAIQLFRPGWLGVPLFLELSIFLLLNRLDINQDLAHYFKRRIRRIWPLYFLSAVTVYLLDPLAGVRPTFADLLLHFVFISFILRPFSFSYVFWTLQLEEWMYLFIPFIHKFKHKELIAYLLIVFSLFYGLWIVRLTYAQFSILLFMPPFWLGAYGWGIIAYQRQKTRFGRLKYASLMLPLLLYWLASFSRMPEFGYELITHVVAYQLILPAFAFLIADPPDLRNKILIFLGEISYGIYVWHLIFLKIFGLSGIAIGIAVAGATELPLRFGEIKKRLQA